MAMGADRGAVASLAGFADTRLAPLVSGGAVPSVAYAVVTGPDVAVGGFGGADAATVFEIGSVTKVFTAVLLACMSLSGEVALSDPAAKYLSGVTGPVTLLDLATHTSGLPRLPPGMLPFALLSPRDPYARYPAKRFRRAARRSLAAAPGGRPYAYSNYGYGLLGYLLGQAAGSSYEDLLLTRICEPLGMRDTVFDGPVVQGYRLSRGNDNRGRRRNRAVPPWRMGALVACGGLRSTAADLAKLLAACLAPDDSSLGQAIRLSMEPHRTISPEAEIGLAWHRACPGESSVIWHNGMRRQ